MRINVCKTSSCVTSVMLYVTYSYRCKVIDLYYLTK